MSPGRQYLTPREKAAILEQQCHGCAICGGKGPYQWDHALPNAFKPGKPDQALCRACHLEKTRQDLKDIARSNRLAGKTGQTKRRKARGYSLIKSNPTIPTRSFDKPKEGFKHFKKYERN